MVAFVSEPAFPAHQDAHAGSAEPVDPGQGRGLRSLSGIHDLGRAELLDSLVQHLDAEVGLQHVRYSLRQNLASRSAHDRHKVEKPAPHGQVGDVRVKDQVQTIRPQSSL